MDARRALDDLLGDPTAFLTAEDPALRRLAAAACAGDPDRTDDLVRLALADPAAAVRAAAVEALGTANPETARPALTAGRDDPDPRVVEATATAYGELGDRDAVPWLITIAARPGNRLVREAAVAALGAIGDERAVPPLLELLRSGPPPVRRRAVVALSVFDGDEIETAIRAATADRNPMVREAAEMVVGDRS